MSFDPITAAFDLGSSLLERVFPDPIQRAVELLKLETLRQNGELAELNAAVQSMVGQLEINKVEAASSSVFIAGWRPFIGWVGGLSLAYTCLVHPMLLWAWTILELLIDIPVGVVPPPTLDNKYLETIIAGLLGLGTMRSVEKTKGIDTKEISSGKVKVQTKKKVQGPLEDEWDEYTD